MPCTSSVLLIVSTRTICKLPLSHAPYQHHRKSFHVIFSHCKKNIQLNSSYYLCKGREGVFKLSHHEIMGYFWEYEWKNFGIFLIWIIHLKWIYYDGGSHSCNVHDNQTHASLILTVSFFRLLWKINIYIPWEYQLSDFDSTLGVWYHYFMVIVICVVPFSRHLPLQRIQADQIKFLKFVSQSTCNVKPDRYYNTAVCATTRHTESRKPGKNNLALENLESINRLSAVKPKRSSSISHLNSSLYHYEVIFILMMFFSNSSSTGAYAQTRNSTSTFSPYQNESYFAGIFHTLLPPLTCNQYSTSRLLKPYERHICAEVTTGRCDISFKSSCCNSILDKNTTKGCNARGCNQKHIRTCCYAVKRVKDADERAAKYIGKFLLTMGKYTTPMTYSRQGNMDCCKVAYKNWMCSQQHRILNDTTQELEINPSADSCLCVEKSCPFFRVHDNTKLYGGQPTFLCQGLQEVRPANRRSCYGMADDSGFNACEH